MQMDQICFEILDSEKLPGAKFYVLQCSTWFININITVGLVEMSTILVHVFSKPTFYINTKLSRDHLIVFLEDCHHDLIRELACSNEPRELCWPELNSW